MPYKDKEQEKQWRKDYDRKRKQLKPKLGTTDFKPHISKNKNGDPDFDKEQEDIDNEFKLLCLKRKPLIVKN